MNTARRKKIYEGKAKIIYEGPEPNTIITYFKDDATAGNGAKKGNIAGKGVLNNRISSHIMTKLEGVGISTHFLRSLNMREQLNRQVEIIPVEVVVRTIAAGSISKRLGIKEGTVLPRPIIEFYYKSDELNDPMINDDHITAFGWADPFELEEMMGMAYRTNDFLSGLFSGIGITLVDFKLEFGRIIGEYGEIYIVLADEISPDNCRLWDSKSGDKMDKDRFRQDLDNIIEGYQEVARRLGLVPEGLVGEGGFNEKLAASLDEIENELARHRKMRAINKPKPTTKG